MSTKHLNLDSKDIDNASMYVEQIKEMKANGTVIVLVHMSSCYHCLTILNGGGAWTAFVDELKNNDESNIQTLTIEREFAELNIVVDELKREVHSFPCIFAISGNNVFDYNGERTMQAFMTWANEIAHSKIGGGVVKKVAKRRISKTKRGKRRSERLRSQRGGTKKLA